jgi:hypothetical protein
MHTPNPELDEAIIQKLTWRNPVTMAFAVAFLRVGLALRDAGAHYFGADDVPETSQPADSTTSGTVVGMLLKLKLIEPFYGTVEAERLFGGRRPSKRAGCHKHRTPTYRITKEPLVRAFIRRHDARPTATVVPVSFAKPQGELVLR